MNDAHDFVTYFIPVQQHVANSLSSLDQKYKNKWLVSSLCMRACFTVQGSQHQKTTLKSVNNAPNSAVDHQWGLLVSPHKAAYKQVGPQTSLRPSIKALHKQCTLVHYSLNC
jgi:hypothetical protein